MLDFSHVKRRILMAGLTLIVVAFFGGYLLKNSMVNLPISTKGEISILESEDMQFLPADEPLELALKSDKYGKCIAYSGIGVTFRGEDDEGFIIDKVVKTYPADKANLKPGFKILKPRNIVEGPLDSPVKIYYKNSWGVEKSALMKRVLVKKCKRN